MKINLRIFAFYLLILAFVPCDDDGRGLTRIFDHWFGVEHVHEAGDNHKSHSCDDDLCSPFCTCSCCSCVQSIPVKLLLAIKPPIPAALPTPVFVHKITPSRVTDAVWQPPQS